ncbi:hypothetical protein BJV78DRAFT_910021 [Lactifluus subvellereus]|nr:hypothetical protein BJV78DRAFT_910021 [Lactifluus subvellereus]
MRGYNVPRLSFITKMDRYVCFPSKSGPRIPAAAVQVPFGVEDQLEGVVDLVRWKAIYNKGTKGSLSPTRSHRPFLGLPPGNAENASSSSPK